MPSSGTAICPVSGAGPSHGAEDLRRPNARTERSEACDHRPARRYRGRAGPQGSDDDHRPHQARHGSGPFGAGARAHGGGLGGALHERACGGELPSEDRRALSSRDLLLHRPSSALLPSARWTARRSQPCLTHLNRAVGAALDLQVPVDRVVLLLLQTIRLKLSVNIT